MNAMRSPTLSQWIASNACDIILNFDSDTQCHELILCTVHVHSGKLKVKKDIAIWGGARFGSPH